MNLKAVLCCILKGWGLSVKNAMMKSGTEDAVLFALLCFDAALFEFFEHD